MPLYMILSPTPVLKQLAHEAASGLKDVDGTESTRKDVTYVKFGMTPKCKELINALVRTRAGDFKDALRRAGKKIPKEGLLGAFSIKNGPFENDKDTLSVLLPADENDQVMLQIKSTSSTEDRVDAEVPMLLGSIILVFELATFETVVQLSESVEGSVEGTTYWAPTEFRFVMIRYPMSLLKVEEPAEQSGGDMN